MNNLRKVAGYICISHCIKDYMIVDCSRDRYHALIALTKQPTTPISLIHPIQIIPQLFPHNHHTSPTADLPEIHKEHQVNPVFPQLINYDPWQATCHYKGFPHRIFSHNRIDNLNHYKSWAGARCTPPSQRCNLSPQWPRLFSITFLLLAQTL